MGFEVPVESLHLPARELLALTFRAAVVHLEKTGRLDAVRPHLPADTAALVKDAPMPFRWVSARHTDDLYRGLEKVAPRAELRELGLGIARGTANVVLERLISATTTLFGATPATLFDNMDRFWTVATRGLAFRWHARTANTGVLVCHFGPPVPEPSSIDVLEGNLAYVFEVLKMQGRIGDREIMAQGDNRVVVLRVSW